MKKNMKFEEAMQLLEDIVRKLESGNLSLDESLSAFEEAVGLVKLCNEKLEDAEQKVRILTASAGGEITDIPFAVNDDEN
jgi:exodeoxyribonuclease VII small subunit